MSLFVSTVSVSVVVPELGITIVHPTTDFDVTAQFSTDEIKHATSLTTAILNGVLVWRKIAAGTIQLASSYDPEYSEVDALSTGPKFDSQVIKANGSTIFNLSPFIQALANSTKILTINSETVQMFSGSTAGQLVNLPNATTLQNGWKYEIYNNSLTQNIPIRKADGTTVEMTLLAASVGFITLVDNTTSNGTWTSFQTATSTVAAGLIYKDVSSIITTTTTSLTYVDLSLMTVTVDATGYYLVLFNSVTSNSNNGQGQYFIINVNGTDDANSERFSITSGGAEQIVTLQKVVFISAGQIIKIRWRRTNNTGSSFNRTLTALKVG